MTPSLALLAAAPLVIGLAGAPLTGATSTEDGRGAVGAVAAVLLSPAPASGKTAQSGKTTRTAQAARTGKASPAGEASPPGRDRVRARRADVVEHTAARSAAEQRRVLDYWTPERMERAVPLDLLGTLTGALTGGSEALGQRPDLLSLDSSLIPAEPAPGRREAGRPLPPDRSRAGRLAVPGRERTARATAPRREHTAQAPRSTVVTSGARWTTGGTVRSTTGRVFLTLGGVDFVCSASAVRSANRDLVVTAGHCVKDGKGAWAENWTFVPGYDRGDRPYGQFTARRMFVAGPWSRSADDSHDIGMVALNTRGGRHLTDVVGAQEIAFNQLRGRHAYGFGFPVDPPYDGEHMIYCAGPVREDPHGQTRDQGLRCNMTAGSSGGPWFTGFDPVTGRGTITSVSSFKYSDDHGTMYGPYFGETARALYLAAQRS
ncbi:hypothetical protein ACFOWE_13295 [Planomonospora corallina]|uniref:V8-like Glu-specific endopeptidase n=1 Tax=Planomonospora corallina TaxID=1806052 RepID=A0ABV8I7X4_9ACTN